MTRLAKPPTESELRVLKAVIDHGTIASAARALHLSSHTVDAHLDRLRDCARKRYLPQLIAWAYHEGLISSEAAAQE